jgi:hypothetical protein
VERSIIAALVRCLRKLEEPRAASRDMEAASSESRGNSPTPPPPGKGQPKFSRKRYGVHKHSLAEQVWNLLGEHEELLGGLSFSMVSWRLSFGVMPAVVERWLRCACEWGPTQMTLGDLALCTLHRMLRNDEVGGSAAPQPPRLPS